jgi:hypothetical protein
MEFPMGEMLEKGWELLHSRTQFFSEIISLLKYWDGWGLNYGKATT